MCREVVLHFLEGRLGVRELGPEGTDEGTLWEEERRRAACVRLLRTFSVTCTNIMVLLLVHHTLLPGE